jgi:hypothetical protein
MTFLWWILAAVALYAIVSSGATDGRYGIKSDALIAKENAKKH